MIATQELVLVRHGETEWTQRGLLHGHSDIPLSSKGKQQAEQASLRLQGETIDAIYSSPLKRAMQTAAILGGISKLTPIPTDGLCERYYGWAEGKPMRLVNPDGPQAKLFRPMVRLVMDLTGESENSFVERVRSVAEAIINNHPQGRVIIVTHWGVLNTLMSFLTDGNLLHLRSFGPWKACGITKLQNMNGTWKIIHKNE